MEKEDKDLLLKDLCGRFPYGVKVDRRNHIHELRSTLKCGLVLISDIITNKYITTNIENITPYLFPLSSMTEGQYEEFCRISNWDGDIEDIFYCDGYIGLDYLYDSVDWFNKNHFDWRGLIPKGLAIDASNLNIY